MKKLLLSSAIIAAAGFAQADYQFEVGAVLGQGDIESTDYDIFGIAGEMYFDKVDTSKGPLAEASFLSQASGVDFSYSSVDIDSVDDIDTFGLGGRVVTAEKLIIELDYSESDTGVIDEDTDSIRFGIGTYLNATTDLVVSLQQDSVDGGEDIDSLNIDIHGVSPLQRGESIGYDLTASYIDSDDDDGYNIGGGATYYPSNILGLGLSANISEVGGVDTNTVSVDVSYFPTPEVQLVASLFDQGGDIDSDGLLVGASVRF